MEFPFFKAHHEAWMKGQFESPLIRIGGGILGLLFLAIFSSGCSNEKSNKPVSAPIPITVGTVSQKTVPVRAPCRWKCSSLFDGYDQVQGRGRINTCPFDGGPRM